MLHPYIQGISTKQLGARGEDAAVKYLIRRGYCILERNWRCRRGEIDIIAQHGDCLVFIEVKLRRGAYEGLAAVDGAKRYRLSRVALEFVGRLRGPVPCVRFDIVAVDKRTLVCTHVENAFDCAFNY